jgi:hypothetical protein
LGDLTIIEETGADALQGGFPVGLLAAFFVAHFLAFFVALLALAFCPVLYFRPTCAKPGTDPKVSPEIHSKRRQVILCLGV